MRFWLAFALAAASEGNVAHAQPTRNIELGVFDPAPATTSMPFQLESADVGANGEYIATALASYAANPLVLGTIAADDPIVRSQTMMSIGGAYAFADRWEVGAHMPFYVQSGEAVSTGTFGVPPATGGARGALTLNGKVRLVRTARLRLGAGLGLRLPTMSDEQFVGSDKPSVRLLALASIAATERLALYVNAGAVLRARTTFANIEQKSGLAWGAGASLRLFDPLAATAEIFGDVIPGGYHGEPPQGSTMGPTSALVTIEALGGVRWWPTRQIDVGVAAGRGITSGIGTPDWRAVLTVAYAPSAPAMPTLHHPYVAPPIPKRPVDPRFANDRDFDRIPDDKDKCPDQPEDYDGFQDEDGCPDPDNDNDGIPDEKDKCPNEPEDFDGFQDEDGCPDPDNDHDGIPDVKDKCPNEPETINGFQDEDGCPDKGDSLVISSPDRLELLEPIAFTGFAVAKKSNNVLGQLAATLRARADIRRIRLTVHVQPSKSPERDQDLSDKRATSVREWLVKWGIAAERLEVKGFGGTKPLVPANSKGAAQINERVEMIILERDLPGQKR